MALKPPVKVPAVAEPAPVPTPAPVQPPPAQRVIDSISASSDLDDPALVLSIRDLHEISRLVGLNIQTSEDLISRIRLMSTLSVADCEVVLEPGLLTRLRSRCLRADWHTWLPAEIKRQLHAFCGW